MTRLPVLRRILKRFHPEGIPWPGTAVYNAVSATGIFQRNYELVARDIAAVCPEGRLLDIGTGPGWLLLKIHQTAPRLAITGVDISPAMVAKARENMSAAGLGPVIQVQDGSADRLPFADAAFDIVVSTGSIHHWKDPVTGINEIHRVLVPGGRALLYDIVSDTPAEVMRAGRRHFGRFQMLMLWLHAFSEPFYSQENFASLGADSLFGKAQTRYVGVLCCLVLKKDG
ncbi:MAG: class I SAM-dependent methyltransferase [Chloroflexota bacterium]